jgi:hypothetical protein
MGMVTALTLGAGLGLGMLLGRRNKGKQGETYTPPPAPAATPTAASQAASASSLVASTNPPDVVRAASENAGEAEKVAAKRRKRAQAGNAGKVTTGPASAGQRTVQATGAPASLLGY